MKALKLLIPTQLFMKGQWWSYLSFYIRIGQYSHQGDNGKFLEVCIFGFIYRMYEFKYKVDGCDEVDFWSLAEANMVEAYFWCEYIDKTIWSKEYIVRSWMLLADNIFPMSSIWSTKLIIYYCLFEEETCRCDSNDGGKVCKEKEVA
jgi:hypothetical protein